MVKIDKDVMYNGAGAGVGVIWTVLSRNYLDATFGAIPGIGTILPHPWGMWSTGGSVIIGGVLFCISQFTSWVKNYAMNGFLTYFGLTTLIGGIMNGIFYTTSTVSARAAVTRLAPRTAYVGRTTANMTPTGIPQAKVLA